MEWMFVSEYGETYEVSEYGDVRSWYYNARVTNGVVLKRRTVPKTIKPRLNTKGKYLFVRIGYRGFGHIIKNKTIHRLVGKYFLDDYSEDLEVNHNDGNRMNNHYSNLSMMTRQENMAHAWSTGLVNIAYGVMQSGAKLTEAQVLDIFNSKELTKELSKKYKVGRRQIWLIKSGRNWSHLTIDKQ
jgi:hypothetical protein